MLPDRLYDGIETPLGDSLAVEHLALTRVALVRIQVPQPKFVSAFLFCGPGQCLVERLLVSRI